MSPNYFVCGRSLIVFLSGVHAQPLSQHYRKRTPKKPYPTMKGIQNMIDMSASQVPQAKNAMPERFVDLSFLQELEKEGFFAEMEKRYKQN